MNLNDDVKEILFSEEEIARRCKELGEEITAYYGNEQVLLVALLKGSVPFLAELIKRLNLDFTMDFMSVSSYEGTSTTHDVRIKKDLDTDLAGKKVLIVEDIIDTGNTLKKVKALFKDRGATDVKIATLLDKPSGREVEIEADFVGFTVGNEFVIGFGLDYNGRYRGLPYVGVIKEEAI